jgi:hypothetical protein
VIVNPTDSHRLARVVQDNRLTFEEKMRIRQVALEVDTFAEMPADLQRRIVELEKAAPARET